MSIDLSAVPTLTDDLGLYDIPLNVDTFPYKQLQAQGRYPDRSTPNTLPEFLATLNASDAGFTPDMLSTDGKRNLNVNIAAGGGGGGGGGPTPTAMVPWLYQMTEITSFPHTLINYGGTPLKTVYGISWTVILETLDDATSPTGWFLQFADGTGNYFQPPASGGWAPAADTNNLDRFHRGQIMLEPPLDLTSLSGGGASLARLNTFGPIDALWAHILWLSGNPR